MVIFFTLDRIKEFQCGGDDKESEMCDAIGSPYKLVTHPEISVTWLCFRCIVFFRILDPPGNEFPSRFRLAAGSLNIAYVLNHSLEGPFT